MALAICPACTTTQEVPSNVAAFRCKHCQRDVWIVECRRCHNVAAFFGSASGSGSLEFTCAKCRRRTAIQKAVLRASLAESRRVEKEVASAKREAAARAREATLLHTEARQAEVARMNGEVQCRFQAIARILAAQVPSVPGCTFSSLKTELSLPAPPESPPPLKAPEVEQFMPPQSKGLASLWPGGKRKQELLVERGQVAYQQALQAYQLTLARRQAELDAAMDAFEAEVAEITGAVERQQRYVDDLQVRAEQGEPQAVVEFALEVLSRAPLPYDPPADPRVAYSKASRQLAIELELPTVDVIPSAKEYRYVKTRDQVVEVPLPAQERGRAYAVLVAQVALLVISEVYRAELAAAVDTVSLNGMVRTTDKRTGQDVHPCLVSVQTTREQFSSLNLRQVDPVACLKGLNASVSRSPAELAPVRPLLEFDMVDSRFVEKSDVLSTLDSRPNLMDLTPSEFESLITNLFERMGLETRLTQPSRDGGVDCVAYDMRPIFGGKVVIQAKRYRDTVGVSAVRDLFGTVQNEGASKGILVATSGFGQASHEFAAGKPLELIDGGNLLYLLHEHAGIDAKIEAPDDWVDPPPPR